MSCAIAGVKEGTYKFSMKAYQRTCAAKKASASATFNSVCIIKETITMIVGANNSNIGDTESSKKWTLGLAFGLIIALLLFLTFCCLYKK